MNKNTMQPNGEFHFHKGHYLERNVINSLQSVENEDYSKIQCEDEDAADYLYVDAFLFLHGSCNLFALALHEEFGYEAYEIRDNENRMNHVFCKATYRGQDVYIDVRGVTTNFVECVSEFRKSFYNSVCKGDYYIISRNLNEDRKLENEGDKTGFQFAQSIIKRYYGYYDVSI